MSIKVYLVYDGEGDASQKIVGERMQREAYKFKITVPEKWKDGPVEKLLQFFCDTYNKKYSDKPLSPDCMYLHCCGVDLKNGSVLSSCVQDYNDVVIRHQIRHESVPTCPAGWLTCTNYGCGQFYDPNNNAADACKHHAKGPIFHDTAKFWGCCQSKKALDWEEFNAIPTCCVGPHCSDEKPTIFKQEEIAFKPLTQEQIEAQQPAQGAVEDGGRRRCGPREFEGAQDQQLQPQEIKDGKATCRNYGCQKEFVVAENTATSCQYHTGAPVFWDTYKYWACCPTHKCAEFDDFVKVPGCTVGPHKL